MNAGYLKLVLTIGVFLVTSSAANSEDFKKGKLAHLVPLIGTYQIEKVLNDGQVQSGLAETMPANLVPTLRANLQVRSPIGFSEGYLVISGLMAHSGRTDTAMLLVRVKDAKTAVGLQSEGQTTLFSQASKYDTPADPDKYDFLPQVLRVWALRTTDLGIFDKAPEGVEWVRSPSKR